MTESATEDAPDCRQCGEPVESTSEHRVVTTVEAGTTVYDYFCSDDCLERWTTSIDP
ncbi:hypothetical protein ACFR99_09425 [Haloarchaeobius amylolyticus]|uniref:TRASH domain-containing protein n=1 Tax=Haloarchaeobius amylolyticus TaxID=1198296 RepID=A0ABD6BFB1_9EURY